MGDDAGGAGKAVGTRADPTVAPQALHMAVDPAMCAVVGE
jgi:hypothetical protein